MLRLLAYGGGVAVAGVLVYVVGDLWLWMDYTRRYYTHHPGECRVIENAGMSSENFHVTSSGEAFITSGCGFVTNSDGYIAHMKKHNVYKGRILLYNFNKSELGAVSLKIIPSGSFDPETFRPHGISVWEEKDGNHLIYVINHPYPADDAVEKFIYDSKAKTLQHVASITSSLLRTTNDLAMLGPDTFYISNFLYSKTKAGVTAENLLRLPWGGMLLYQDGRFTEVVPGLVVPNGVVMSPDQRYVYVAMCILKKINVYRREKDNSLTEVQSIPAYTIVDNLHLSQDGSVLYAGCHPVVHRFMDYDKDPSKSRAPSQVLEFPLVDGLISPDSATELFYDNGALIAASTQGAVYGNKLLIGSLVDVLVECDLDKTGKPKTKTV